MTSAIHLGRVICEISTSLGATLQLFTLLLGHYFVKTKLLDARPYTNARLSSDADEK